MISVRQSLKGTWHVEHMLERATYYALAEDFVAIAEQVGYNFRTKKQVIIEFDSFIQEVMSSNLIH